MASSDVSTHGPKETILQGHLSLNESTRPFFELCSLLKKPPETGEIHLCALSENLDDVEETSSGHHRKQTLAFASKNGDLFLMKTRNGESTVVKRIPWYLDPERAIAALTFDSSGEWLLVIGADASFSLVPVSTVISGTSSGVISRHGWATGDITSYPSLGKEMQVLHPTCVAWWENAQWGPVAVLGSSHGEVLFIDLATGSGVGSSSVRGSVKTLHVCHDSIQDSVFLLITNANREQWKLLLEQRKYGYCWPLDRVDVGNAAVGPSGTNSRGPPRTRLQGLKQLSVEKLSIIKQKLAESRKGAGVSGSMSPVGVRLLDTNGEDGPHQKRCISLLPEKLGVHVGETFISPQNVRGHPFLSGYYAPSSLLTVHTMSLECDPNYIHRLPPHCRDVLLTDCFIFTTNQTSDTLTVVSCQLSKSCLEGNSECNPESVVQKFSFVGGEQVLGLFKRTGSKLSGGTPSGSATSCPERKGFPRHPRVADSSNGFNGLTGRKANLIDSRTVPIKQYKSGIGKALERKETDTCIVVTTHAVYQLQLRQCPSELFLDLALKNGELEEAERVAQVFELDLQSLLEIAGDLELASKSFTQAISFYKLSRCHDLKSVLKFAAGGHSVELLSFIETVIGSSSVGGRDLSPSERIHLSNLAVMAHVERVLRSSAATLPSSNGPSHTELQICPKYEGNLKFMKRAFSSSLLGKFLRFLHDNQYYDEVLAVSVVGQTALWEPLKFLCSHRGLHREALSSLSCFLQSVANDGPKGRDGTLKGVTSVITSVAASLLDSGLWDCLSDPALLQHLLEKPELSNVHLCFINSFLHVLDAASLQKLAVLYDPSSSVLYPSINKLFKEAENSPAHKVAAVGSDSLDESVNQPVSSMLEMFMKVILHLKHKRSDGCPVYIPDLMRWTSKIPSNEEEIPLHGQHKDISAGDCQNTCAEEGSKGKRNNSVKRHPLTAGYAHAALAWNRGVLTWGNTAHGCLGHGPTISRYSFPQDVRLFPSLGIEVLSVSCGRQHTLALTSNGVYAWGSAQFGQIGIGMCSGRAPYPRLVERLCGEQIVQVSAGQYHSLALTDDGRVYSWGWGVYGQLGHGDVEDCIIPTVVSTLEGMVRITDICGGHCHSLALTAEGKLMAWGSSVFGQLGHGMMGKSSLPVAVSLPEPVTIMATGYFHNLAVGISNRLYTWGSSPQVLRLQAQAQKKARIQQIQEHCPPQRNGLADSKKQVAKMQSVVGIANEHEVQNSCHGTELAGGEVEEARKNEGDVIVNASGVEGESQAHLLPSVVNTSLVLGPITQVSCGCHHSALLTKDGTVYMWGRSLDGQVGNGTRREAPIPEPLTCPPPPPPPPAPPNSDTNLPILTRLRASHIACGCEFTLALERSSSKLWAWGSNSLAQLGKNVEENPRSALQGKRVILKTTKRVIRFPQGAQNSSDLPYLVPWLPPLVTDEPLRVKDGLRFTIPRGEEDVPCYGHYTLHRCLEFFHKHYNSQSLLSCCLELEDFQAAAKIMALDRHFHQALGYQLKALYMSQESDSSIVREAKKKTKCETGRVVVDEESPKFVKDFGRHTSGCETHSFAIQGGAEEMSEVAAEGSLSVACLSCGQNDRKSDRIDVTCLLPGPLLQKSEGIGSQGMEETYVLGEDLNFDNKYMTDAVATELLENPGSLCTKGVERESSIATRSPEKLLVPSTSPWKSVNEKRKTDSQSLGKSGEELAFQASVVVEHYTSLLEEEGHMMVRHLLEQGINFWLAHSLPMGCLETLLIKHMSKFFYPLGLMLFCDGDREDVKGESPKTCFDGSKSGTPGSILGQLSTRFCLQLCSTLLSHIRHKKVAYPEYVELLAQVMAMQSPFSRDNGDVSGKQVSSSFEGTPEQMMETVLENMGLVGNMVETVPPPIHVVGESVLSLLEDECVDKDVPSSGLQQKEGETVVFSCGHHFHADRFRQSVLPETELALLGLHHPLPHTARLIRGLFSAAVEPHSSPPKLQLACPNCVLSHLQAQV